MPCQVSQFNFGLFLLFYINCCNCNSILLHAKAHLWVADDDDSVYIILDLSFNNNYVATRALPETLTNELDICISPVDCNAPVWMNGRPKTTVNR